MIPNHSFLSQKENGEKQPVIKPFMKENISDDIAHSNMCQSYISFQGYIENAPQCSGHGTYMCGICQCAPDFFGRRCECDAENLSFHGDLEAGCRPDNTTTTLCNNRGDCICGKCECYPRENPNEVSNLMSSN